MRTISKYVFFIAFLITSTVLKAQIKESKTAEISFYSEKKELLAPNKDVKSTLNTKTGEITFEVMVEGFNIENGTMKKHFLADGVMDVEHYPKAIFEGKIDSLEAINWKKRGTYEITVTGDLTIRGETQTITQSGSITIEGKKITSSAEFDLDRFIYGVTGKEAHISQVLQIKVNAVY